MACDRVCEKPVSARGRCDKPCGWSIPGTWARRTDPLIEDAHQSCAHKTGAASEMRMLRQRVPPLRRKGGTLGGRVCSPPTYLPPACTKSYTPSIACAEHDTAVNRDRARRIGEEHGTHFGLSNLHTSPHDESRMKEIPKNVFTKLESGPASVSLTLAPGRTHAPGRTLSAIERESRPGPTSHPSPRFPSRRHRSRHSRAVMQWASGPSASSSRRRVDAESVHAVCSVV